MNTANPISELTQANHDNLIKDTKPVLIKFFATWCGPCKAMAPAVEALAQELSEQLNVVEADIDKTPELVKQYGIQSVPTLVLVKNGESVKRITGVQSKGNLEAIIQPYL